MNLIEMALSAMDSTNMEADVDAKRANHSPLPRDLEDEASDLEEARSRALARRFARKDDRKSPHSRLDLASPWTGKKPAWMEDVAKEFGVDIMETRDGWVFAGPGMAMNRLKSSLLESSLSFDSWWKKDDMFLLPKGNDHTKWQLEEVESGLLGRIDNMLERESVGLSEANEIRAIVKRRDSKPYPPKEIWKNPGQKQVWGGSSAPAWMKETAKEIGAFVEVHKAKYGTWGFLVPAYLDTRLFRLFANSGMYVERRQHLEDPSKTLLIPWGDKVWKWYLESRDLVGHVAELLEGHVVGKNRVVVDDVALTLNDGKWTFEGDEADCLAVARKVRDVLSDSLEEAADPKLGADIKSSLEGWVRQEYLDRTGMSPRKMQPAVGAAVSGLAKAMGSWVGSQMESLDEAPSDSLTEDRKGDIRKVESAAKKLAAAGKAYDDAALDLVWKIGDSWLESKFEDHGWQESGDFVAVLKKHYMNESLDEAADSGKTKSAIAALRDEDYKDKDDFFKMTQLLTGIAGAAAKGDETAKKFLSQLSDDLTGTAKSVLGD